MSRSLISAGVCLTISLGFLTSSAQAIALLVPAVQKVSEAAAEPNADLDGDGIAESSIWMGELPDANGDVKPVLMVIANQDFYYQEYADTRIVGEGEDAKLVMSGPAMIGRLDAPEKAAVCHGVSVLAYARVDGSRKPQPVLTIETDGREPLLLGLILMY